MPIFSHQDLVLNISKGLIGAVSIDTTVFDSKQKNFRQTDFRAISQFRKRGASVIITDVIANEMKSHLEDEASESQRDLKKALRANNLRWHREQPKNEVETLLLDKSPAEFAKSEFTDFLAHVGAQILAVAETPDGLAELFRRYFLVETPFGSKESRKREFPDAAALLRLEAYAKEKKTLVLCIAQDKAWVDFAAKSDHLVVIYPLNSALGAFSEAFKDQDLADEIVELWRAGGQEDFETEVRNAVIDRLASVDFDIDAESDVSFEAEPMEAELLEIQKETLSEPVVLAADETTVTFSIDVAIKAKFNANFSFAAWDSIDREFVGLGDESADTTNVVELSLTIVADRDVSEGIQHREISVSQRQFTVYFGYVDAFPAEEPDDTY